MALARLLHYRVILIQLTQKAPPGVNKLLEMMNVIAPGAGSARSPEEKLRFERLVRTLTWAKEITGKSSTEITSVILRKGKDEIARSCNR